MKPLTPEEEALLIKLQQHKEEYRIETVHCVNTIWAHITDDEGNLQAEKMVANAKQIRLLLEPYDEAPVMLGEFVPPAVSNEPRVVDVTGLHDVAPRYVTAQETKLAPWCSHEDKTMVFRVEADGGRATAWRCDACLGITDDPNA